MERSVKEMIRIKKRKNPTDEEFLKKVQIKKKIDSRWNVIDYKVFLNEKQIALMQFDPNDNTVFDANVESDFRRKGLSTYVYNYIEQDLGIKIKPNHMQLDDGIAFWKNRLKKSNPIDKTFLSKIKISKTKIGISIVYKALLNNHIIATAEYVPNDNSVSSLWVNTPYRRKGLASFMYNTIEKDQKVSLQPSQDLLPDGRRFWENRLKGKPEKLGLLYR